MCHNSTRTRLSPPDSGIISLSVVYVFLIFSVFFIAVSRGPGRLQFSGSLLLLRYALMTSNGACVCRIDPVRGHNRDTGADGSAGRMSKKQTSIRLVASCDGYAGKYAAAAE